MAHLIVGQVRGFLDPRVLHSLRTQTIEAFGGVPDVFLYLKLELNDDLAAIEAAARSLGPRVQLEANCGRARSLTNSCVSVCVAETSISTSATLGSRRWIVGRHLIW